MCHRKFFLFVFLARKQEVVCGFQFLCHPVSVYKQADRPYACHPFVTIASELDEYLLVNWPGRAAHRFSSYSAAQQLSFIVVQYVSFP